MTLKHRPTLEEFLQWPEQKPYLEFIHGEVRPQSMPDAYHSHLQTEVAAILHAWSKRPRIGWTQCEQRCLLTVDGETAIVLPDVAWWSLSDVPALPDGPMRVPPALAFEILCPDDRYGDVQDKVVIYLKAGVDIVVVVDARSRSLTIHRAHGLPHVLTPPAVFRDDALRGLVVATDELFAAIPPADERPRIQE